MQLEFFYDQLTHIDLSYQRSWTRGIDKDQHVQAVRGSAQLLRSRLGEPKTEHNDVDDLNMSWNPAMPALSFFQVGTATIRLIT